jgi:hypothetical protein
MVSDACMDSFQHAFSSRRIVAGYWETTTPRNASVADATNAPCIHFRHASSNADDHHIRKIYYPANVNWYIPHIEMNKIRTPLLAVNAALRGRP